MKTTVHLHRPAAAPAPERPIRHSTLRLGVMVSAFAALAAIVLSALTDVPTVAILITVVVIGFTLSWHAAGHRDSAPPP
jgi:flagellar biosynthesis protein FliQ